MNEVQRKEARSKILELAESGNWYGVVWNGHFGRYFVGVEHTDRSPATEIYSAIFESYYDLTKDDKQLFIFDILENDTWVEIFEKVKVELEKIKNGVKDERQS